MEFTIYGVEVYRNSEDHPWNVADCDALVAEIEAKCPDFGSFSTTVTNVRDVRP
jgi:hypothetical protein